MADTIIQQVMKETGEELLRKIFEAIDEGDKKKALGLLQEMKIWADTTRNLVRDGKC